MPRAPAPTDLDPLPADELLAALQPLLGPLARLAVARGLSAAALEEALRLALVQAADAQHAGLLPHRRVSRISTATGLHRREVTRLVQRLREGDPRAVSPRRSPASEVFARWCTDPRFRDRRGHPRVLPRQGSSPRRPSFEMLAQSVTRDVHPRSLLDELLRLGLATLDEARDTVALTADAFVPRGDAGRMLQFLGANVGDHLAAAVDNVLADGRRHLEQAVFADGLSEASLATLRTLIARHWKRLHDELVPALQRQVAQDRNTPGARRRLRVGLYSFDAALAAADEASDGAPAEPAHTSAAMPAPTPAPAKARS